MRELLAIGNATAQQAVFQARQANPRWNPAHATSRLPEGWGELLAFHCACLGALQAGNRVEAYEKAVAALQPFLKVGAGEQAVVRGGGVPARWRWRGGFAHSLPFARPQPSRHAYPLDPHPDMLSLNCRCSERTPAPGW
jgi:hypothetical protein